MLRETLKQVHFSPFSTKAKRIRSKILPTSLQTGRHKGPSAVRRNGANDRKAQVTVATSPDMFSEIVNLQGFDLV